MENCAAELEGGKIIQGRTIVRIRWVPRFGWLSFPRSETFASKKAFGVAFKIAWFGEGAERLVKEFREVDKRGCFVSPPMVAKGSRFIIDGEASDEKTFHKVFLKTQLLAQKFASKFNRLLLSLPNIDRNSTPTIEFLECSDFMIHHPTLGRHWYLVEKMLDIRKFTYKKWNDNAGYVAEHIDGASKGCEQSKLIGGPLEAITESEDVIDEGESSDDEDNMFDVVDDRHFLETYGSTTFLDGNPDTSFDVKAIPQAFSCFTYRFSHRKLLVCDLQGILNTDLTPPVFELTDPVIHYKSKQMKKYVYGRTDNGLEGIHDFVKSHTCSNLCRMLSHRHVASQQNAVVLNVD